MRPLAAFLLLASCPAWAGTLYENRQEDQERLKLEKTERLSERGAYSPTADKGAHQAGRPFHGTGKAGPGGGRTAVPVIDTPYRPTAAGGPLSTGGPIRTPFVGDCPNGGASCRNVTPYQSTLDRIKSEIKKVVRKLQAAVLEWKKRPGGLLALALAGMGLWIGANYLAQMIAAFRLTTDQKKQAKVLRDTALELERMSEQIRRGAKINPAEIELRSRNAGKRPRKDIKDLLDDKEK